MFKIQGSDQREYGPVSADVVRQWIAERRVDGRTLLQAEGVPGWKPAAEFPEFIAALGAAPPALPALPAPPALPVPPMPRPQTPSASGAVAPAVPATTSGMAVASLICSLLGCLGITALVGLVLGVVAQIQINRSNGRLKGSGLAIAGISISALMLVVGVPMAAGLVLPALTKAKGRAQTVTCVVNMKQLALGARLYASENKDRLPPADSWCDAVQGQLTNPRMFVCHSAAGVHRCTYAMNRKVAGKRTGEVNPQTVLFFEIEDGWNVAGGPELIQRTRHPSVVVALVGGSVRQLPVSQLNSLRWDP